MAEEASEWVDEREEGGAMQLPPVHLRIIPSEFCRRAQWRARDHARRAMRTPGHADNLHYQRRHLLLAALLVVPAAKITQELMRLYVGPWWESTAHLRRLILAKFEVLAPRAS